MPEPDVAAQILHDLRREYANRPLDESSVGIDPWKFFKIWFDEACAAKIPEPNAMSLATADLHGHVTCRTVLLKAYSPDGFVFFTNYQSRKSHQLAVNPHASILFPWLTLARQVEIQGRAEKLTAAASLAYFLKRPFQSKVGAWVSAQSSVISSRQWLEAKFEEMCRKFTNGDVPLPPAWGGYRIIPDSMEFWQGGPNRLHDRLRFSRNQSGWQLERLAP